MLGRDTTNMSPRQEGFILLGTQNPVTYQHRIAATAAWCNRFEIISVADYTCDDLFDIAINNLNYKRILASGSRLDNMAEQIQRDIRKHLHDYQAYKQYAQHYGTPCPNARSFFLVLDELFSQYDLLFKNTPRIGSKRKKLSLATNIETTKRFCTFNTKSKQDKKTDLQPTSNYNFGI